MDHCEGSEVNETIDYSTEERAQICEDIQTANGENYLLNVLTPLELGGRANPNVNFPPGLTATNYDGCIRNLYWNGQVSTCN